MPDRSHWAICKFSSFEKQRRDQVRQCQQLPASARADITNQTTTSAPSAPLSLP